jgi:hypothetical protein
MWSSSLLKGKTNEIFGPWFIMESETVDKGDWDKGDCCIQHQDGGSYPGYSVGDRSPKPANCTV